MGTCWLVQQEQELATASLSPPKKSIPHTHPLNLTTKEKELWTWIAHELTNRNILFELAKIIYSYAVDWLPAELQILSLGKFTPQDLRLVFYHGYADSDGSAVDVLYIDTKINDPQLIPRIHLATPWLPLPPNIGEEADRAHYNSKYFCSTTIQDQYNIPIFGENNEISFMFANRAVFIQLNRINIHVCWLTNEQKTYDQDIIFEDHIYARGASSNVYLAHQWLMMSDHILAEYNSQTHRFVCVQNPGAEHKVALKSNHNHVIFSDDDRFPQILFLSECELQLIDMSTLHLCPSKWKVRVVYLTNMSSFVYKWIRHLLYFYYPIMTPGQESFSGRLEIWDTRHGLSLLGQTTFKLPVDIPLFSTPRIFPLIQDRGCILVFDFCHEYFLLLPSLDVVSYLPPPKKV